MHEQESRIRSSSLVSCVVTSLLTCALVSRVSDRVRVHLSGYYGGEADTRGREEIHVASYRSIVARMQQDCCHLAQLLDLSNGQPYMLLLENSNIAKI